MKSRLRHRKLRFLCSIALIVLLVNTVEGVTQDPQIISTGRYSYSLTLTTTASQNAIWQLWQEVENWKSYDTVLQYSYLDGDAEFVVGATGYVKARRAPKTKFELTEVNAGTSFTESLKLPLWSTLELKRRSVKVDSQVVAFTHEVEFKGRFKRLMYFILAKRFKADLKMVMQNMKALAEHSKE